MKLSTKIARLVPPLARLHGERNRLLAERSGLLSERDRILVEFNALKKRQSQSSSPDELAKSSVKSSSEELSRFHAMRAAGRLVEFDYPYFPRRRDWNQIPGGNPYERIISKNNDSYAKLIRVFLELGEHFSKISVQKPDNEVDPFWDNGWLPALDGITIYGLLAQNNPRLFMEVGSGNSTKFARRAIKDHGLRTKIVSIDPHPRADIDAICDEVIRQELENVDLNMFSRLENDSILFIDNSHRSFQNSDVTVFFTEILPLIGPGCIYGIHDICLPADYPPSWMERYYNEQYLLMTYLLGGAAGDEVIMPAAYIYETKDVHSILDPILQEPVSQGAHPWGAGFWLRRG
jgi:hypothetical protein